MEYNQRVRRTSVGALEAVTTMFRSLKNIKSRNPAPQPRITISNPIPIFVNKPTPPLPPAYNTKSVELRHIRPLPKVSSPFSNSSPMDQRQEQAPIRPGRPTSRPPPPPPPPKVNGAKLPPPPPPPPGPSFRKSSSAASTSSLPKTNGSPRATLLAEIQAGAKLKPVGARPERNHTGLGKGESNTGNARNDMINAVKQGAMLKPVRHSPPPKVNGAKLPPPPPPPPGPSFKISSSAASTSLPKNNGSPRANLLAEILAGAKLKPVGARPEKNPAGLGKGENESNTGNARNDMINAIKQGAMLKPVNKSEENRKPVVDVHNMSGLAGALSRALESRRNQILVSDNEDDRGMESEWE